MASTSDQGGKGGGRGDKTPSAPGRKYSAKQWAAIKARLQREGKWNPRKRSAPQEEENNDGGEQGTPSSRRRIEGQFEQQPSECK